MDLRQIRKAQAQFENAGGDAKMTVIVDAIGADGCTVMLDIDKGDAFEFDGETLMLIVGYDYVSKGRVELGGAELHFGPEIRRRGTSFIPYQSIKAVDVSDGELR